LEQNLDLLKKLFERFALGPYLSLENVKKVLCMDSCDDVKKLRAVVGYTPDFEMDIVSYGLKHAKQKKEQIEKREKEIEK